MTTDKTCSLCGSDDLQKADEMMIDLDARGIRGEVAMTTYREVSALRAPHMNRECVAKAVR